MPTNIALSNASVNEHQAAGATVGTFSATDPDSGETDTYTLVSEPGGRQDNASSFTISGNTLKTAANFLNYQVKNSYSVRVQLTDHGGLTYQKSFTVSVNNINDAPVAVSKAISNPNETIVSTRSPPPTSASATRRTRQATTSPRRSLRLFRPRGR